MGILLLKCACIWSLGRLILTSLFYFSYTSHKPCSLLWSFLISVKKENNLRWLEFKKHLTSGWQSLYLENQIWWIFYFLMTERIIIWSTQGRFSLPFLCSSHRRSFCETGVGCSEAVALQAHNPWGICSAYSCAVVVGLTGMWACAPALPGSVQAVDAKYSQAESLPILEHQGRSSWLSWKYLNILFIDHIELTLSMSYCFAIKSI